MAQLVRLTYPFDVTRQKTKTKKSLTNQVGDDKLSNIYTFNIIKQHTNINILILRYAVGIVT